MSPTNKNYNLLGISEVRMEMNGVDSKIKRYNKVFNVTFDNTAGYCRLVINGDPLEFDFRDDQHAGYTEYHFSKAYQRAGWIVSEKVFIKIFDETSTKPEILFNVKFNPLASIGSGYSYYLQDNGIADCRGFLYKKGGCLNRYHMNIKI